MKRVVLSRRLALWGLGAALVAALPGVHSRSAVRLDSSTAVLTDHHNTIGNGTHNHNAISINSPTHNKGAR